MAEQLTFSLPARDALERDAFFVSQANAVALATLDGWASWPVGKLVLVGPRGAGKTHLAHVWAAETGARILHARELAQSDIADLARLGRIVVEDADRIGDLDEARPVEEALFHLHNLLMTEGGRLLLTGAEPPSRWRLALPDLASRMEATPVARIEPPDDALLAAMLVKQFADRQLHVPPTLIPYLVARMERSADAARDLVARLDAQALREGRAITRAMAGAVLDNPGPDC